MHGRLDLTFNELGALILKNIARPIEAFLVSFDGTLNAPSSDERAFMHRAPRILPLPDKPSIAVLAFNNLSRVRRGGSSPMGWRKHHHRSPRIRWLFVIARNSSFTYKGHAVDVRQVARELGVRYVLEGSVQRGGDSVRVNVQLIDAEPGRHVWADRYDRRLADVFAVQDEIAEAVAGMMEPTLQRAEIERARRRPPDSLDAYDQYLRGLSLTDTFTRESVQAMLDHCMRSVALDGAFAPAFALAGRAYIQRKVQGYSEDEAKDAFSALDLVERGLRADRSDAMMLATGGLCFAWFAHDLAKGIRYIDEALVLNPNFSYAFMQSGILRVFSGLTTIGIEHLDRARRLSPRDSGNYATFAITALAHQLDGDLETARDWALRSAQHNPNYAVGWLRVASVTALLGQQSEARAAVGRVLSISPTFSVRQLQRSFPISVPEMFESYWRGLRLAGLPE